MPTVRDRFWNKVDKNGPVMKGILSHCWVWTGSTKNGRYGNLWVKGKNELAHRVSWFLKTGRWPIPNALHKCDNTMCVRFEHLFEGDQKDNSADCKRKGRMNHFSKLTEKEVKEIRKELSLEKSTQAELAKRYNVTKPNILMIKTGRSWAHI